VIFSGGRMALPQSPAVIVTMWTLAPRPAK
jgi:hypothetical protein